MVKGFDLALPNMFGTMNMRRQSDPVSWNDSQCDESDSVGLRSTRRMSKTYWKLANMNKTDANRIVVMTGATSGIGANAAVRIAAQPNIRLIIGARGGHSGPEGAEVIPLDLASLASVRTFADDVKKRLDGAHIDMLVLNAGIQTSDATQRTVDGFEVTFAVNHLAHYLLARLLVPCMADDGRLVITTSDTHDPAVFSGAPKTLDPEALPS